MILYFLPGTCARRMQACGVHTPLVLTTCHPSVYTSMPNDLIDRLLNEHVRATCVNSSRFEIADTFAAFEDAQSLRNLSLRALLCDGFHPNRIGSEVVFRTIADAAGLAPAIRNEAASRGAPRQCDNKPIAKAFRSAQGLQRMYFTFSKSSTPRSGQSIRSTVSARAR